MIIKDTQWFHDASVSFAEGRVTNMGIWYLFLIAFVCMLFEYIYCIQIDKGIPEIRLSKFNKQLASFIFLILMLLTTVRGENVGTDTKVYVGIFENVCNGLRFGEFLRWEIGFQKLYILISYFTDNPRSVIIVTSLITYALLGRYISKYVDNKLLFIIIFFSLLFANYMNIMRQAIALSIVPFAYEYLQQKKNIKAILLIVVSMVFHYTSVVFLGYMLVKNIRIDSRCAKIIVCSVSAVSLLMGGPLIGMISKVFPRYEVYFLSERVGTGYLATIINLFSVLVIFLIYYIPRRKQKIPQHIIWLLILCLCATSMSFVMNLFMRLSYVFYLPLMKECCQYIPKQKRKKGLIEIMGVLILLSVFMATLILRPEWCSIYPYSF